MMASWVSRDKKLRQLAVVFLTLAVYRIRDVLLLKDQVACIGDVGQNAFQAGVLKAAAVDGADAFRVQRRSVSRRDFPSRKS